MAGMGGYHSTAGCIIESKQYYNPPDPITIPERSKKNGFWDLVQSAASTTRHSSRHSTSTAVATIYL